MIEIYLIRVMQARTSSRQLFLFYGLNKEKTGAPHAGFWMAPLLKLTKRTVLSANGTNKRVMIHIPHWNSNKVIL